MIRRGDHPSPTQFAELLEDGLKALQALVDVTKDVPEALAGARPSDRVIEYVAARIRDEIPLGDGGRPAEPEDLKRERVDRLREEVEMLRVAFRRQKVSAPKTRALERITECERLRVDTSGKGLRRKRDRSPITASNTSHD